MLDAARLHSIQEEEHCAAAAAADTSLTMVATTAGGTSTGGSPGSGHVQKSQSQQTSCEAHTKTASQWIQEMQPKAPSQARAAACGAGLRSSHLRQLQALAPTASLCIFTPQPPAVLAASEDDSFSTSAPEPPTACKVFIDPPNVVCHGPLQRRHTGFAGIFWSWRSYYAVLTSSVFSVYTSELEWREEREPLEVFEVPRVIIRDDSNVDGYATCTFALIDRYTKSDVVFRCNGAYPGPFDHHYSAAAKKLWIFAWMQAKLYPDWRTEESLSGDRASAPSAVLPVPHEVKLNSMQRNPSMLESGTSTASTALGEDTECEVRPVERGLSASSMPKLQ